MKKRFLLYVIGVSLIAWWIIAAPPKHHQVTGAITYSTEAESALIAADHSTKFADSLQLTPSNLPGHDDVLFYDAGRTAVVSGMDGKIWSYDLVEHQAQVLVDPPLMAAGLHESPTDHDLIYFCSSYLWGDTYPPSEAVGLYRLRLSTKQIEAVVTHVPNTSINGEKVWGLDDNNAPSLRQDQEANQSDARPLAFCNDLEISEDGQRIYFSEPFSYEGASMGGGTVPEVIAHNGNGRLWMHDLSSSETRLIAEGFFFVDGVLVDLHETNLREQSLLVSLTPGFSLARFYVDGPKSGSSEFVQQGLTGMCDGLDRDQQGRIWCAMFAKRTTTLTWIHANPWIKHILLRLPLNWLPQPKETGVVAFSADASEILYSAWYQGEKAAHIASAIPGPDDYIYLTPFSRQHRGLVRFKNPLPRYTQPSDD